MFGPVYVPVSVLLEFECVMHGFYALPRAAVLRVLHALLGIEHVSVEDRAAVLVAVDAFAAGLDFADALHLARSARCASLVPFDRRLARRAKALGLLPAVQLLA